MQGKDARVWKRVGVFAPTMVQVVRHQKSPDVFMGVATDMGPGGMYISTDEPAECDDIVALDVNLVEFGEQITESGRVVRSDADGFAVKFLYRCEMFDSVRQL